MNRTQQNEGTLKRHSMNTAMKSVVALMAAAVPLLAGCTTDVNGAFIIVQNQVPELVSGACAVPSKASETRQIAGTGAYDVDLDKPYPYFLYPLLRNDLPVAATEGTIEVNRIEYTGVEVKIEPPAGVAFPSTADCPTEFKFAERASIPPTGEVGSAVQVFLPCHSATLLKMFNSGALPKDFATYVRFKVTIRAIGKHGNGTLKSDPFEYIVRVCKGCLQTGYSPMFAPFEYPGVPACTALAANPYQGNPCNPAQDGQILCCKKADDKLDCPGRPAATSAAAP
ncbi:MAG: hypothetical protein SF187_09730 [Deltaproteobacteria bacterium]|nr:hypothetical protein [Deltaproteobacteria bacterium]